MWEEIKLLEVYHNFVSFQFITMFSLGFSVNGAELLLISVNSANSENLRNHWSMNWVQYKDQLCYLCLCGLVVSSLSLTQEILGSNLTILIFWFLIFFFVSSLNSAKTFRESSTVPNKTESFDRKDENPIQPKRFQKEVIDACQQILALSDRRFSVERR